MIMKKGTWKIYAAWILFAEAVGGLSAWVTRKGMDSYMATIQQPPLSPPEFLFPIVWGILFALMGAGAARVYLAPKSAERTTALTVFLVQLLFNFIWTVLFFNLQNFGFALVWLVLLWVLILQMLRAFYKVSKWAGWAQAPYLLWVTFAGYLNYGVWSLNRP